MLARGLFCSFVALLATSASAQKSFVPTSAELVESYQRGNSFGDRAKGATFNLTLRVTWSNSGDKFWYVRQSAPDRKAYVLVDSASGKKAPAFDHSRLAAALSKATDKSVNADTMNIADLQLDDALKSAKFSFGGDRYRVDLSTYGLEQTDAALQPRPTPDNNPQSRLRDGQIEVFRQEAWQPVTKLGSYARYFWSPDRVHMIAFRLLPGDRKQVHLLKSSLPNQTRATLESRLYDQPGDKLDSFETYVVDSAKGTEIRVALDPIMGGGQPWVNPPAVQWINGLAVFDFPIRGYQEHFVVGIEMATAKVTTLVHEQFPTFVDQSKTTFLPWGDSIIWTSERDGWCHMYRVNTQTGDAQQLTRGEYVVRSVEAPERDSGTIWFTASGLDPKQDPYHIHACRIQSDGTGLVNLTPGDGTHAVQYSPNRRYLVDTYSRVDQAPVHELRSAIDGKLIAHLETADIETLLKNGVRLPERFVAKGRDGKTDIWGIVIKPSNFDPKRKYPVIEDIYAGPHDSFVPKAFRPTFGMHALAELGFIVVQIDGMGTNNRGKAFHDVCWKNIADAGFPDRILWLQALKLKMPQVDLDRVGIYGTSAGGQESAAAMLFHPEFYKVAVSACGCHDNRIDKQWWNEQWMGYPVGPHYDAQSNITNADKLQGKLMLIVGENDRNVPPESTFRFANALIRLNKDFELVVIPGADHTSGGPFGEKKRRDYFVRWLHRVQPPSWDSVRK